MRIKIDRKMIFALVLLVTMLAVSCGFTHEPAELEPQIITYLEDPNEGMEEKLVRPIPPTEAQMKQSAGKGFGAVVDNALKENVLNDENIERIFDAVLDAGENRMMSYSDVASVNWTTMTAESKERLRSYIDEKSSEHTFSLTENKLEFTFTIGSTEYSYSHDAWRNLKVTARTGNTETVIAYSAYLQDPDDEDTAVNWKSCTVTENGEAVSIHEYWRGGNDEGRCMSYTMDRDSGKKSEECTYFTLLSDGSVPSRISRTVLYDGAGIPVKDTLRTESYTRFMDMRARRIAESDLIDRNLTSLKIGFIPEKDGGYDLPAKLKEVLPDQFMWDPVKPHDTTGGYDLHTVTFYGDFFNLEASLNTPFESLQDAMITAGYRDTSDADNKYRTQGEGFRMEIVDMRIGEMKPQVKLTFDRALLPDEWK